MKTWQILVVVALGIAFGSLVAPGKFEYAFGHAMLYVFLPPLLFEAAWNTNYRAIVRQWPTIATLAGPGVIVTALIVAGALCIVHVPFRFGLVVGAILSATDPIAVTAVFRRLKVPKTLTTIVECEALFNDAAAVTLYGIGIVLVGFGAAPAIAGIAVTIALALAAAFGGIAFGIAVAFVAGRLLRNRTDEIAQIETTIVCAFGSYLIANALHLSGIFSVIACGIALRYFERRWIPLRIADDVGRFWDATAIGFNALVFFMVGAVLPLRDLVIYPAFAAFAILGVVVGRFVVAGVLVPAGFPRSWQPIAQVAGLRGALSLALALALPSYFAYREPIVDATFAVVLFTLVAGGSLAPRFASLATRRQRSQARPGRIVRG